MIKMINKFGNSFTCEESEMQYWLDQGATIVKEEKSKKESKK